MFPAWDLEQARTDLLPILGGQDLLLFGEGFWGKEEGNNIFESGESFLSLGEELHLYFLLDKDAFAAGVLAGENVGSQLGQSLHIELVVPIDLEPLEVPEQVQEQGLGGRLLGHPPQLAIG